MTEVCDPHIICILMMNIEHLNIEHLGCQVRRLSGKDFRQDEASTSGIEVDVQTLTAAGLSSSDGAEPGGMFKAACIGESAEKMKARSQPQDPKSTETKVAGEFRPSLGLKSS